MLILRKNQRRQKTRVIRLPCLCLTLEDPGGGHCGEAHTVPNHQHNIPAIRSCKEKAVGKCRRLSTVPWEYPYSRRCSPAACDSLPLFTTTRHCTLPNYMHSIELKDIFRERKNLLTEQKIINFQFYFIYII